MGKRIELFNISRYSKGESVLTPKEIVDFYLNDGAEYISICDLATTMGFREFRNEIKKHEGITGIYSTRIFANFGDEIGKEIFLTAKNLDGLREINEILYENGCTIFDEFAPSPVVSIEYIKEHKNILLGIEFNYCMAEKIYGRNTRGVNNDSIFSKYKDFDYVIFDYKNYLRFNNYDDLRNPTRLKKRIEYCYKEIISKGALPIIANATNIRTKKDVFCFNGSKIVNFLRTEKEIRRGFSFLDEELLNKMLVENPNRLFSGIKDVFIELEEYENDDWKRSISKSIFSNMVKEEAFRKVCFEKAKKIFNGNIPKEIEDRLEKELNIVDQGLLYIYQEIARLFRSNNIKFIPKGSITNLYISYLLEITDVNPLNPYYYCGCGYVSIPKEEYFSKYELKDCNCPRCNKKLQKEGYNLPIELYENTKRIEFEVGTLNEEQIDLLLRRRFEDKLFNRAIEENVHISKKELPNYLSKEEKGEIIERCKGMVRDTTLEKGKYLLYTSDLDVTFFGSVKNVSLCNLSLNILNGASGPFFYEIDINEVAFLNQLSRLEFKTKVTLKDINLDSINIFDFCLEEDFEGLFEQFKRTRLFESNFEPALDFGDLVKRFGYENGFCSCTYSYDTEPFYYIEDMISLLKEYGLKEVGIRSVMYQTLNMNRGTFDDDIYMKLKELGMREHEIENFNLTYKTGSKHYGIAKMKYLLYMIWYKINKSNDFYYLLFEEF